MLIENQFEIPGSTNVVLISVICPHTENFNTKEKTNRSLGELKELMRTLSLNVVGEFIQSRDKLDPATLIGKGKLNEVTIWAENHQAGLLIFDHELSASQVKNIASISKMTVLDRCQVILEIFSKHARTHQAMIQVNISKLKYLLPRLTNYWSHFGKQKGGIGLKGEGEQQLELDRRMIRERISKLQKKLDTLSKSRIEQAKRRSKNVLKGALVGYTNVGKSTLLNKLCSGSVLSEDKLFATLDARFKLLTPDSRPPIVLIDTVGFLSNLPSSLIEGFKSTLQSASEAELLIIVSDASDPFFEENLTVTEKILNDLKLSDTPKYYVFNKIDKVKDKLSFEVKARKYFPKTTVNAFDDMDLKKLRKELIEEFVKDQPTRDYFIPYEDGASHSVIRSQTQILTENGHEKGIFYRIRAPKFILDHLNLDKFSASRGLK